MNDLIAEHIMGWVREPEDSPHNPPHKWRCVSNEGDVYFRRNTPGFDTLACHAFQVVEKLYLGAPGRIEFSAQRLPDGRHMVAFWEPDTGLNFDAIDESFERAVCIAALKKVGVDAV